jgi:hypothetical protein
MCLGLVTLGIAVSRGDDPSKPDTEQVEILTDDVNLVVDETAPAKPEAPGNAVTPPAEPVKARFTAKEGSEKGELVEIQLGSDDGLVKSAKKQGVRVQFKGGQAGDGVLILNEEGAVSQQIPTGTPPHATRTVQYYARQAQIPDPESREALEKLLGGLREEAKRLENEGKAEEASQKIKAIQALEQLLKSQPMAIPAGRVQFYTQSGENDLELKSATDELNKAQATREKLSQRLKVLATDSQEAAKHQQELQAYDEKIDSMRKRIEATRAGGGTGIRYLPAPPGLQLTPGGGTGGMMRGTAGPGMMPGGMVARWGAVPVRARSKSAELAHQADVLSQSAAQLKEAGFGDQAKQLAEQAEKLKDQAATQAKREAEQLAAHAHATGGFGGGGIAFTAGPPMELHRSIKELQEQVQMLRKEVAELREILQPKRRD